MSNRVVPLALRLERATEADFQWLIGECAPARALRIAPDLASAEVLQLIRTLPANWLMIADDEIVGIISLKTEDADRVEIGYGVAASRWGQGFASAAVAALLPVLRERAVARVLAETSVANPASQRVLERNGFAAVGERVDDEDGCLILWECNI